MSVQLSEQSGIVSPSILTIVQAHVHPLQTSQDVHASLSSQLTALFVLIQLAFRCHGCRQTSSVHSFISSQWMSKLQIGVTQAPLSSHTSHPPHEVFSVIAVLLQEDVGNQGSIHMSSVHGFVSSHWASLLHIDGTQLFAEQTSPPPQSVSRIH